MLSLYLSSEVERQANLPRKIVVGVECMTRGWGTSDQCPVPVGACQAGKQ